MPVSDFRNVPAVVEAVIGSRADGLFGSAPMKILDVGAGFAKFGVIFREGTDIGFERYERETWTSTIDAVEIWERWITPMHRHVYNNIFIEDFTQTASLHTGYDVVFMGDVIEHMEREVGERVLRETLAGNRAVVLSIPDSGHPVVAASPTMGGFWSYLDNPHEVHKSRWYKTDFPNGEFFPSSGSACFVVRVRN